MTEAGADIVVAHMGCTSGGTIGAETVTPARRVRAARSQEIVETCKSIREDVILPLPRRPDRHARRTRTTSSSASPGIDGFYGASSTERFPTEVAIKEQIERFKAIRLPAKG